MEVISEELLRKGAGVQSGRNGTPLFLLDCTAITLIGTMERVSEWAGVLDEATSSLHLAQEYITAMCEIIRG